MGLENMGKDIVVLCLLAGSVLSAGCEKGGTVVSSCKAETPVNLDSLERRNIALRDTGGTDTYYTDGCVRGYAMPMLADRVMRCAGTVAIPCWKYRIRVVGILVFRSDGVITVFLRKRPTASLRAGLSRTRGMLPAGAAS